MLGSVQYQKASETEKPCAGMCRSDERPFKSSVFISERIFKSRSE